MTFKKIVLLSILTATAAPYTSMAASRTPQKSTLQEIACLIFQARSAEELTEAEREIAENLFAVPGEQIDSLNFLDASLVSLIPWIVLRDNPLA
jgi:hypothetical protein